MDEYTQFEQRCAERSLLVKKNEPMHRYTSFKIGGPCKQMVFPKNIQEVQFVIQQCSALKLDYFVLGNGSNLLVSDAGYSGVILSTSRLREEEQIEDTLLRCGAGVSIARLCRIALNHRLTGLEFAFGIPGYVGGAAYMNAGAYGGEMKDVIYKCRHIDRFGKIGEYEGAQLKFSYRHSVYCSRNDCITDVYFRLQKGDPHLIRKQMTELYQRRKDKQPLHIPNAGSIFKRPQNGYAAALIEQCGLKGKQIGGAKVSEKHAGFIVNTGTASCEDVKNLIQHIQNTVYKETGIPLEREVKILE